MPHDQLFGPLQRHQKVTHPLRLTISQNRSHANEADARVAGMQEDMHMTDVQWVCRILDLTEKVDHFADTQSAGISLFYLG